MKKIFTFLVLFIYVGINGLSAQPQTENIRREIKQKGASAHLLTEMARIFSTSQPDSAIHYVKLAQAKKPTGTDLITLNAALGEANMAQGKTEKALQLFTHAQKLAVQQKNQHENIINSVAWVSATVVCKSLTKPLNVTSKLLTTDLSTAVNSLLLAIKIMLHYAVGWGVQRIAKACCLMP